MTYQIGKVAKPNNVRASEIASTLQHTQHGKTEDAAPSHVDDTSLEEINRQQHVINMIDEENIQKQKLIVREKSKFAQQENINRAAIGAYQPTAKIDSQSSSNNN